MKKRIISIIAIFVLLSCFVACDQNGDQQDTETSSNAEQTTQPQETESGDEQNRSVYDILGAFAKQSYGKVTLDITTLTGDFTLSANYSLTANEVTYSVERLNMLPTDGNFENVSSDYKQTLSGTATIENGEVTTLDGESVTLPSYDELEGNFDFKESNFKNVAVSEGRFSAEVVSASAFMGTDKSLHNMKIIVEYNDVMLQKITITYNTSNSNVTSVYVFEN